MSVPRELNLTTLSQRWGRCTAIVTALGQKAGVFGGFSPPPTAPPPRTPQHRLTKPCTLSITVCLGTLCCSFLSTEQ